MSKAWTQHQAREKQTTEADQLNAELRASQGSITTLDRTQTPATTYSPTYVSASTFHDITVSNYGNPLWGSGSTQGEQTTRRSASGDTRGNQWRAVQYQEYSGGWQTGYAQTLTGFKGGSLFVEWAGMSAIFIAFQQTANNNHPANGKWMNVRITVGGVVLVDRQGAARPMDNFRVFGSGQYPTGDLVVEYQWRFTASGQDDALVDQTPKNLFQAHIWGNKTLCFARYR
jgi:hypothetical protein